MVRPAIRLQPQWNTRAFTYDPILLYTAATLVTVLACLAKLLLVSINGDEYPYLLFFIPIVFSAWIGGLRTGLYATVLSGFITYFLFLTPLYTFSFKDPTYLVSLTIFLLEGGFISMLSQNMHNAVRKTEVKNSDLVRSEERYRLVVESVKDYAIYTLDKEGYITSWNQGSEHTKGYTPMDVIGKNYSIFFTQDEIESGTPWKYLVDATEKGKLEFEGWRTKKDGSQFWANSIISPIIDETNVATGFSIISRDLTERLEMERRKDDFISIASHELRTPVTSMKVFTQVLIKQLSMLPDKTPVKYLFKMDNQIDRLSLLVNDLLDVSRIQSGKIDFKEDNTDLTQLTQEIIENMQALSDQHKIIFRGCINEQIRADKDRIGQVLINFISNAIKYSPAGDRVEVTLSQDTAHAYVSVRDYGVGIPEEYKDKIFDKFFRVYDDREKTYPGLGMGLYIASEIVRRHNGSVWVESEIGKGSTFFMSLPIKTI